MHTTSLISLHSCPFLFNLELVSVPCSYMKESPEAPESNTTLTSEELDFAAAILKAIAHPIRLAVVQILSKEERLSVNEICQRVGSEQSLTSHHLSNMKLKGILGSQREGQRVYYYLKLPALTNLLNCLDTCVNCF